MVIREIRDRVDLVELVGSYVSLRRSGRGFVGICPFHQEKTGSFHVNPDRGIYHCFGCGATGDAYRFLMEHDHLSFPEALEELSKRTGIPLPVTQGQSQAPGEYEKLYRAHEIASQLYRETLDGPGGQKAREEIARRRFDPGVVREFHVGAAPEAWDRLLSTARRADVSAEILEKAGLAIRRESGSGHYDRFRDRLMFPIEVMGARVVGFGGRVLGEGDPKYLNSPETPLFRKRKTLYGLPQASAKLRETKEAILVEGYMDVLALASVGMTNVIGALGTAFTPEHASVLARVVERVFVVFDGDAAGMKAMMASAGPLLGAGLDVRVVLLPPGEDPDSLIRDQGVEVFRSALAKNRSIVDALLGDEAYEGGAGRDRALRRALAAIAELDDPLRRSIYIQEIASRTGMQERVLEERVLADREKSGTGPAPGRIAYAREAGAPPAGRVAPSRPAAQPPERASSSRQAQPPFAGGGAAPTRQAAQPTERASSSRQGVPPPARVVSAGGRPNSPGRSPSRNPMRTDRLFLGLLVHLPGAGEMLLRRFGAAAIEDPLVGRIMNFLELQLEEGSIPSATEILGAFADDEEASRLLGEVSVSLEFSEDGELLAQDCARRLVERELRGESKRLLTEVRKAQASGDDARIHDLNVQLAQTNSRLIALEREALSNDRTP